MAGRNGSHTVNSSIPLNLLGSLVAYGLNLAISLFLTPFIVREIGVEANGFISLGVTFVSYANLALIALNSMAARFVSFELHRQRWGEANRYFSSLVVANAIAAGVTLVVGAVLIVWLPALIDIPMAIQRDVQVLYLFLLVNHVIGLFGALYSIGTFATDLVYLSSLRSAESRLIQGGVLVVVFMLFAPSVAYVGIAYLAATIYVTAFSVHYARRFVPTLSVRRDLVSYRTLREVVGAGVYNTISELSYVLLQGLDLLVANVFLGARVMGVLALAKTIGSAVFALIAQMSLAFLPRFTRDFALGRWASLRTVASRSIRVLGLAIAGVAGPVLSFADVFYALWVPSQDSTTLHRLTVLIVGPMAISGAINAIYLLFGVANRLRANALVLAISGALNVLVVWALVHFTDLGIWAIAGVSGLIGVLRDAVFTVPFVSRYAQLQLREVYVNWLKAITGLGIACLIGVTFRAVMLPHSWLTLAVAGGLTAVLSCVAYAVAVLTSEERSRIWSWLGRRLRRS